MLLVVKRCVYVHSTVASPGCVAHREAVASGAGAAGTFCGHMASPPFDVDEWLVGAKWADGDLEVKLPRPALKDHHSTQERIRDGRRGLINSGPRTTSRPKLSLQSSWGAFESCG